MIEEVGTAAGVLTGGTADSTGLGVAHWACPKEMAGIDKHATATAKVNNPILPLICY